MTGGTLPALWLATKARSVHMRKIALLIAMVAVAGCGGFKKTFGIKDAPPAHSEPKTTSIYGDWVLANIDSTAFAGARSGLDMADAVTGLP